MLTFTEKLAGHETLPRYRTSDGTVWCLSKSGRYAWPLLGRGSSFGFYDTDGARAAGQEVDRDLDRGDYRVRGAGPAWQEMYEALRSGAVPNVEMS